LHGVRSEHPDRDHRSCVDVAARRGKVGQLGQGTVGCGHGTGPCIAVILVGSLALALALARTVGCLSSGCLVQAG